MFITLVKVFVTYTPLIKCTVEYDVLATLHTHLSYYNTMMSYCHLGTIMYSGKGMQNLAWNKWCDINNVWTDLVQYNYNTHIPINPVESAAKVIWYTISSHKHMVPQVCVILWRNVVTHNICVLIQQKKTQTKKLYFPRQLGRSVQPFWTKSVD